MKKKTRKSNPDDERKKGEEEFHIPGKEYDRPDFIILAIGGIADFVRSRRSGSMWRIIQSRSKAGCEEKRICKNTVAYFLLSKIKQGAAAIY